MLDKEVSEVFPLKKVKGDIGIELEIEGDPKFEGGPRSYWRAKPEPSLRGGFEYILQKPCSVEELPEVLEDFKEVSKGSVFTASERTSLHVHINAQKLTLRQLYSVITFWWFIEDILVRSQGSWREGNLHCLRLTDAELIFTEILQGLHDGSPFGRLRSKQNRYAALNFASVSTFGSIEFRFMKFPPTLEEIRVWSEGLYRFVHYAKTLTKADLVEFFDLSGMEILKRLLTPELFDLVLDTVSSRFVEEASKRHISYQSLLMNSVADHTDRYDFGEEDADNGEDPAIALIGIQNIHFDDFGEPEFYNEPEPDEDF